MFWYAITFKLFNLYSQQSVTLRVEYIYRFQSDINFY